MTTVTTAETTNKIQIVELNPTINVTVTGSQTNTVTTSQSGSAVEISTVENPITVKAFTATGTTQVDVVESVIKVESPQTSVSRILDLVRTDAADTSLVYDGNEQLTSFTNNDVTKSFTYNPDGTIATVTTVTGTETVTKAFGYTDGNLTSITVS
jgi:YD repeat-containing protein